MRKAVLIATAAVFLLFASAFGLVAGYYALIDPAGFSPVEVARLVDKRASAATRQVGPLPLVMIALAADVLAARR